jgi:hypothetical protein
MYKEGEKGAKNGEKTLLKHILKSWKNQYFKKLRRDFKKEVEQSLVFFLVKVTS